MPNSFTLRKAGSADASVITELALRSKAHWGYSQEFMAACREELAVTPARIAAENYHCVVAEQESIIRGFYAVVSSAEDKYDLEALFVEPAHIGQGLGKLLLDHALEATRACGGKTLLVQSDPNAEYFYRAAGGKLVGKRQSGSIAGRELPVFQIDLQIVADGKYARSDGG